MLRNGKWQILNLLLPGDLVGIPGSFLKRAANSVTAITDLTMNVYALDSYVQLCYRSEKLIAGSERRVKFVDASAMRRLPIINRRTWHQFRRGPPSSVCAPASAA